MLDPERLNKNLRVLHEEVRGLREELDEAAALQHEASLQETLEVLAPAVRCLVRLRADVTRESETREVARQVAGELESALPRLGLSPAGRVGQVAELWPEQASRHYELDRGVPEDASMVRVEVVASGWARDEMVLAKPLAKVLEVVS